MKKRHLIWTLCIGCLAVLVLWRQFGPAPAIPVGMLTSLSAGKVLGASKMQAYALFLEDNPESRIKMIPLDDEFSPEQTVQVVEAAIAKGIRFFISSHPSKCAIANLHLFSDSRALTINLSSASPDLSNKDDFYFNLTPDAIHEQLAIAKYINQLPGEKLLVLQDTSNLPYSDPAFASFSSNLTSSGKWQITHHKILVSSIKAEELRNLMEGQFDALYILAGTFQPSIKDIAQLFHSMHPYAPILLTPWARSPEILEFAGEALDKIILPSIHPARAQDPAINSYFTRLTKRFLHEPLSTTISIRQALELLDQAFAKGFDTPKKVKQYLLSTPTHDTSLGKISFDQYGDVSNEYFFIHNLAKELL